MSILDIDVRSTFGAGCKVRKFSVGGGNAVLRQLPRIVTCLHKVVQVDVSYHLFPVDLGAVTCKILIGKLTPRQRVDAACDEVYTAIADDDYVVECDDVAADDRNNTDT